MQKTCKKLLLALVLCSLLLVVPLTMAEEATGAEAQTIEVDNTPKPAPLIFLLGAGAIVIVGLVITARNNFRGDSSS